MAERKKSYIKEAEQNALNLAKYYVDMFELIDSLEHGMAARATDFRTSGGPRQKMLEGFGLIRDALYQEQQMNLARCFALVGVGGKDAQDYSKKEAQRIFGGRYSNIDLLDEYFRIPHSWRVDDEQNLVAELKEALGND